MSYPLTCDHCGGVAYHAIDPYVEVRVPRPSDRSDLCCIMAGHASCFGGISDSVKTPAGWDEYIESPEAYAAGYLFLT